MVGSLARTLDPKVGANAHQGFLNEPVSPCLADSKQIADLLDGELLDKPEREHRLQSC